MDSMNTGAPAGNPAPAQNNVSSSTSGGKNITMAVVAYLIFFIPLLTDSKNDPFVKFHVKQSIVLLITCIVWMVATFFLSIPLMFIPVIGWVLSMLINFGFGLFVFILWIMGLINASSGKETPLPLIGGFGSKLNF